MRNGLANYGMDDMSELFASECACVKKTGVLRLHRAR